MEDTKKVLTAHHPFSQKLLSVPTIDLYLLSLPSQVHEDNYVTISPCQESARRMWQALAASHQTSTAGGRYMHLRSMMSQCVTSNDDVSKFIVTMDTLRQRLLNFCADGTVSVNDLYISSLISALPDDWTSVTAPLELQATVTPMELKSVLWGHLTKLKNCETSFTVQSLTALSTSVSSKKTKSHSTSPRPECSHCKLKGHLANTCHWKLLEDQQKEINALKQALKNPKSSKAAKVAVSDLDTNNSDNSKPSSKTARASSGCVKLSRAARKLTTSQSHLFVYNADTGCTNTLMTSSHSLKHSSPIPHTPIFMADDTTIKATEVGPIHSPISIPSIPGLVVPGLTENLLSIGQLGDHGVTSVLTNYKVEFFQSPITVNGTKLGEGHCVKKNTWYNHSPSLLLLHLRLLC